MLPWAYFAFYAFLPHFLMFLWVTRATECFTLSRFIQQDSKIMFRANDQQASTCRMEGKIIPNKPFEKL